jgi:hypothetical protein
MSQTTPFLFSVALAALSGAVVCAALIGCGSSSPKSESSAAIISSSSTTANALTQPEKASANLPQVKSPNQVVVRIGKQQITKGELYRWMSIKSEGREVPEPPEFNRCIINLRKREQVSAGGEGHAANGLKEVCANRYAEDLEGGLGSLMNNAWLIGEAEEDGIAVAQREVEYNFEKSRAVVEKSPGGLTAMLKRTGFTLADLKYEVKASLASDKVYERIAAKTPKLTPARVARYYRQHKGDYSIPGGRDLYILHTKSKAAALAAKAEITAGKSFATIASTLKVSQPLGAKEGRDRSLTRKSYAQHSLIDAIFSARAGVLSGPFELHFKSTTRVALGFYVFEVLHKIVPRQPSFAEVKAQLEPQLAQALRARARKDFVAAYKAKWRARTNCSSGYVVENCRQYRGKEAESPDPYVL